MPGGLAIHWGKSWTTVSTSTFTYVIVMITFILNPELQLVLDDSERIRHTLQDFRPVLDEISTVCDISTHEERVKQNDQQVHKMQCKILEPLQQLKQTAVVRIYRKRGMSGC